MKNGNGKIANLPEHLRDELNWRINDGDEGKEILAWINAKPETVEVLNRLFDGKPISEQNLSLWRTHGYLRWHAYHVIMRETAALADNSDAVKATRIDCEKMLWALKANYADMIQRWLVTPTDQMTYRMQVFKHLLSAVLAMDRSEIQHERLELLRDKQAGKSESSGSSASVKLSRSSGRAKPDQPALSPSNGSVPPVSLSNRSNGHSPSRRTTKPAQAANPKPAAKTPSPTNPPPKPPAASTEQAPTQQAGAPRPTHSPPTQPAQTTPPVQPKAPPAPPEPKTPPYMDPRSTRPTPPPKPNQPPYMDPRSLR